MKEKYASQIELLHGIELGVQKQSGPALINFYSRSADATILSSTPAIWWTAWTLMKKYFLKRTHRKREFAATSRVSWRTSLFIRTFRTAGHLDYICRYIPQPRPEFHYEQYADVLDPILRYLIDNGKALEVNTAD